MKGRHARSTRLASLRVAFMAVAAAIAAPTFAAVDFPPASVYSLALTDPDDCAKSFSNRDIQRILRIR